MGSRPQLVMKSGMPLLGPFADNWENVQCFQARENDVMINTYPKSGTTWASEIVDLIFNNGDIEKSSRGAIFERVPFIEFDAPGIPKATKILDNMKDRRVIKSHLPVELVPPSFWEKNCKIIYVARNAKDVLVSYYHFHHMCVIHPEPGTLDEFLQTFMVGPISYGLWSHHVKDWWKIRQQKNVLYLFYEDMIEDLKREIRKVLVFLEKELPDDIVEKIYQQSVFKTMKENPMANYSTMLTTVMDHTIFPFMRKGICGDWKDHLTVAQNEILDEYLKQEMSKTDLVFRYQV